MSPPVQSEIPRSVDAHVAEFRSAIGIHVQRANRQTRLEVVAHVNRLSRSNLIPNGTSVL